MREKLLKFCPDAGRRPHPDTCIPVGHRSLLHPRGASVCGRKRISSVPATILGSLSENLSVYSVSLAKRVVKTISHAKEGKLNRFIGIIATVFCLLFTGFVTQVGAMPHAGGAPEIDPGVASSAIGLLVCGVLMLTAKRKRRKDDRASR
jgi:hypothetical protein